MAEYIVGNDGDESILDLGEFELRFQEREEIVRCRDCVLAKESMIGGLMCTLVDYVEGVRPDDFCSWGEKVER